MIASQTEGDKNAAQRRPKNGPRPDPQKGEDQIKQTNSDERLIAVRSLPPVSIEKDGWDIAYIRLTALLVCVGIGTFIAIWIQAVETRRAAEAARDSVRIQGTALRQWVDTRDWYLEWIGDNLINIIFNVVNPTQIPLWLDVVILATEREEKSKGIAVWLVPNKPYPVALQFSITDEQQSNLEVGGWTVDLKCSICFRDALQNQWQQESCLTLTKVLGENPVTEYKTLIFDSSPTGKKNQQAN